VSSKRAATNKAVADNQSFNTRQNKRKRNILLLAFLIILILFIYGFVSGKKLDVNTTRVSIGLDSPIKVALLADTHISTNGKRADFARQVVEKVMEQQPDLILLGGDYVSTTDGINYLGEVFEGITAPLGVYAVLGNHDYWEGADEVKRALETTGVKVLMNGSVIIQEDDSSFVLVGIDDIWSGKPDWQKAFRDIPSDKPLVLLSHNPDAALNPTGRRADLIISGHTHAGQVYMPYWMRRILTRITGYKWPPMSEYGYRHMYGLIGEDWGQVYITSGAFLSDMPPRWYTRPEVAILELK